MMRRSSIANQQSWPNSGTAADPFAVNPIRRSVLLVVVSSLVIGAPWLVSSSAGEAVMVTVGWIAMTGIVFGLPVLVISLLEAGADRLRAAIHPPLEALDLTPRVQNVLKRHGYCTIADVEQASDTTLLLLSNMEERGVREIRKQLNLRSYEHWQEKGFPAGERGSAGARN